MITKNTLVVGVRLAKRPAPLPRGERGDLGQRPKVLASEARRFLASPKGAATGGSQSRFYVVKSSEYTSIASPLMWAPRRAPRGRNEQGSKGAFGRPLLLTQRMQIGRAHV